MVEPTHVFIAGNTMKIMMDSGEHYLAYPTPTQVWIVTGGSGGGTPGDGTFIWPFPESEITSEFQTPERPNHDGLDFGQGASNQEGTPIPAIGDGVVETAGVYFGYGNTVILDHGILTIGSQSGKQLKSLYGHMVDPGPVVSVGQTVTKGQTLGGIGQTGQSQGNHLHLETWLDGTKSDPHIFLNEYAAL